MAAGWLVAVWAWPRHAVRRDPGLSVLLITVDTLRADALGAYGNTRGTTPWMDRLAAEGVRFDSAHAHNVVTLPSHANILSGRYPLDHGVRDNAGFRFPAEAETLATLLQSRGWRTGAFVSAFPLDSRFGLTRGFDIYEDRFGDPESQTAFHMQERPGAETVTAARRWLDAQGDARTFCWVHVYEPHFPYEPPEPFASRYRDRPYAGEVAASDAALGALFEPLLAAGPQGRTLVVLTADHGESLGEHGEMTHGIFAYEATLRVPLLLYQPGILRPGVSRQPVGHVDILPTVLDALGVPALPGLPGASLLPVAAGDTTPRKPAYFEALSASLTQGWAPLRGVIRDRVKYIGLPLPEVYDLEKDPREDTNLAAARAQLRDELKGLLQGLQSADTGTRRAQESAETRERLRSLGYVAVAAAARERYTDEDDPKRLIALDGILQEAIGRYRSGDSAGALATCEDLVRRRSDMPLAWIQLAFLRREVGDLRGAVEAARRAVALNPEDTEAASFLAVYLNEAGRSQEALRLTEAYAARPEPDVDVLIAQGVALASLGRPGDAIAAFQRVRSLDPSNAMALVNIGTVRLVEGDASMAEEAFRAALALDPHIGRAHNSLGVLAARQGHAQQAIEHWRTATRLNPRDHEALFNLGSVLIRQGQRAEARAVLEQYLRVAPPTTEARDIARIRQWLSTTR